MSQGVDRVLHKAVRTLVRRNATLHQRLYEAAKELPDALCRREKWPRDLFPRAEGIGRKLTAKGKVVDSICAMDTSVAAEVAEEIVNLAFQIDIARSRSHHSRGHRAVPQSKARPPLRVPQGATRASRSN